MIKIFQVLSLSKNIKTSLRPRQSICPVTQKSLFGLSLRVSSSLTYKHNFMFSSNQQTDVQKRLIVPYKGYLAIRNSQNMDLAFETNQKMINILIGKNSTVQDVNLQIKQKLNADHVQMVCNEARTISDLTPFQALLDRNVFVILNNDYSIKVQGELLRHGLVNQHLQEFQNLQLPLITLKDIQSYSARVNTWIEAKYGAGFQNTSIKIPKNEAKKIMIQSLVDPLESTQRLLEKEEQFQKLYWEVQQLLDKKSQAAIECSKVVRNRLSLGFLAIMTNITFIWSGTYIYYSWDIIEPIAYFVSSVAGIILCSRFFKIKTTFSLMNYKKYMIGKSMPQAMKNVGLDINQLTNKQMLLAQLQAEIKDYYLKRL